MKITISITAQSVSAALRATVTVVKNVTVAGIVYVAVRVTVRVNLRVKVTVTVHAILWMDFVYALVN